ncbi:MAG: RluA family pseudouridine synthase [Planctomycetota bacterium]
MSIEEHRLRVEQTAAGTRLDVFLAAQPDAPSRTRIQELIRAGEVTVDEVKAKPGQSLEWGQEVCWRLVPALVDDDPELLPQGDRAQLRVLYEDADLYVVDKQPHVTAHRTRSARDRVPNVSDLARTAGIPLAPAAGDDRHGIVHRLDKETSGVMVLAKHDEALHFLKAQFKQRTTKKEYLALVFGEPRFDSDWVERPVAVHPKQNDRMVIARAEDQAKEAQTFYEVVERFRGYAYVRCKPKTGRTHQIRIHMTSIGHSILEDRIYIARNAQQFELPDGAPGPGRQCLHAHRLEVVHPRTHEPITFEAPLPADMVRLLEWMRASRSK